MWSLKKRKKKFFLEDKKRKEKKSFFSQKGITLDNFVDLSICPWRSSNEVQYLAEKSRLFGPFMLYNIDGPEGVDYQTLYIFYIQNLKERLRDSASWGLFNNYFEKICNKHFDFLSVHYLYFRDLWLRPTSILDVWTNEEEVLYVHINYYKIHYYGWSNPRLFVNLAFPLISNFSYFLDFSKGPDFRFLGYNKHEYVSYAYSFREKQRLSKFYHIPAMTKEKVLLNRLLPLQVQEDSRDLDLPLSQYSLFYEASFLGEKFDLSDFYYFSFYYLRQSFFLQTLFLDSTIKKVFQYGLLGFFFFNSTSFFLDETLEKRSVALFGVGVDDDPVDVAEDLVVDEDDFGYESHIDADILLVDDDTEEEDDFEDEALDAEDDLEPLYDIGFLDFEVEEDVNDEMEFNEDRISL